MTYEVIEDHAPDPGKALTATLGDELRWERRPTEWKGWLYCESGSGVSGWVPERWLDLKGGTARMLRDYDATELTVSVGETLSGEIEESGWVLARNESGQRGWVPLRCLTPSRMGQS